MNSLNEKFSKVLQNKPDNYLLPFLWIHGESHEALKTEIEKIYESGIRAVCVESRTHEQFCKEGFWEDMQYIFDVCESLGLEVWLLDDKHFPTGFANGAAALPENRHLAKQKISEYHTEVAGPVKDASFLINVWLPSDAEILKIAAFKRKVEFDHHYTGEYIDLTDKLRDGMVTADIPEGYWSVFTIYKTSHCDGLCDLTNPDSVDMLINEVYKPFYDHFSKYFGNTFRGFFSDEPRIMHEAVLPASGHKYNGVMPTNKYITEKLTELWGDDPYLYFPALYYPMDGISPKFRVAYMDTLSALYGEHFCYRLGNWSRAHGVEYIGHVIEDNEKDASCCAGGHFFRSLDGQDMAGIDVVLNEIMPGFQDINPRICHGIMYSDTRFFNYELAKLASSHSHIQPEKKGRAMCEMYGAYGWAEGLKMMKWLSDHMLVRGINYFVPHAFSGISPDTDSVPHFYEGGTYSQFKDFKLLMEYSNRVSTLLSDGVHKCKVALLYRAESEWAGGVPGKEKTAAKVLTDNQIDFDIIPLDYLEKAIVKDGAIVINNESYPCFIVPERTYVSESALKLFKKFENAGVSVVYAGGKPEKTLEGNSVSGLKGDAVPYESLAKHLREKGFYDIRLATPHQNLRYYRYIHGDTELYMFVNEDVHKVCNTVIYPEGFSGGKYTEYEAMSGRRVTKTSEGGISLHIEPYNSLFIILSDMGCPEEESFAETGRTTLPDCFDISIAEGAENYTFTPFEKGAVLGNFNAREGQAYFGGHIKYATPFNVDVKADKTELSIEYAGETANVYVNGKHAGARIIPPYSFDISELVKEGENLLEIVVTTHLGYKHRDRFSRFMTLEPTGLSGKIDVINYKKN